MIAPAEGYNVVHIRIAGVGVMDRADRLRSEGLIGQLDNPDVILLEDAVEIKFAVPKAAPAKQTAMQAARKLFRGIAGVKYLIRGVESV